MGTFGVDVEDVIGPPAILEPLQLHGPSEQENHANSEVSYRASCAPLLLPCTRSAPLAAQVRSLRTKRHIPGIDFDFSKLYYLSLHMISSENTFQYGKKRIGTELTEDWMNKKLSHAGLSFDDTNIGLGADELKSIPGAVAALESIDSLKLEVCVRTGLNIDINPDECRYWSSQEAVVAEEFQKLKEDFDANYRTCLASIIEKQQKIVSPAFEKSKTHSEDIVAVEDAGPGPVPYFKPEEFDSIEDLTTKEFVLPLSSASPRFPAGKKHQHLLF